MNEKINLTKQDGSVVNGDIICAIENVDSKKRYLYYTLNEIVGNDMNSTVKIYVTKVRQDDESLDAAITKEEWDQLKGYMSDALKGNANPSVKYIPLSELVNPVSVSEMAIAMPTSYDYINKQRGIYAQSIATLEPTKEPEVTVEPVTSTESSAPAPMVEKPVPMEPQASLDTPKEEPVVEDSSAIVAEPIDIQEIENKYAKMIEDINRLKEQEIEAINRYNATIKLSSMHNEQHASYVQNEQSKDNGVPESAVSSPAMEPTPVENNPIQDPAVAPIEPVAIEPVVPEPVPASSDASLETNWFDMPANN